MAIVKIIGLAVTLSFIACFTKAEESHSPDMISTLKSVQAQLDTIELMERSSDISPMWSAVARNRTARELATVDWNELTDASPIPKEQAIDVAVEILKDRDVEVKGLQPRAQRVGALTVVTFLKGRMDEPLAADEAIQVSVSSADGRIVKSGRRTPGGDDLPISEKMEYVRLALEAIGTIVSHPEDAWVEATDDEVVVTFPVSYPIIPNHPVYPPYPGPGYDARVLFDIETKSIKKILPRDGS